MVVQRRHQEHAFARRFEGYHLYDDRQARHDIHNAYQQHGQRHFAEHGDARQKSAERHRSGIAHEDLRRVRVVKKERTARAAHRRRKHYHIRRSVAVQHVRRHAYAHYRAHEQRIGRRHGRGEPVQPVGQVDRVGKSEEDKNKIHGRERAELYLFGRERHEHRRADGVGKVRVHRHHRGEQELEYYLLHRRKPFVVLVSYLDKIVDEPDERVADGDYHYYIRYPVVVPRKEQRSNQRKHDRRAAHGRRARFRLVVVHIRKYGLSRFKPFYELDIERQ